MHCHASLPPTTTLPPAICYQNHRLSCNGTATITATTTGRNAFSRTSKYHARRRTRWVGVFILLVFSYCTAVIPANLEGPNPIACLDRKRGLLRLLTWWRNEGTQISWCWLGLLAGLTLIQHNNHSCTLYFLLSELFALSPAGWPCQVHGKHGYGNQRYDNPSHEYNRQYDSAPDYNDGRYEPYYKTTGMIWCLSPQVRPDGVAHLLLCSVV